MFCGGALWRVVNGFRNLVVLLVCLVAFMSKFSVQGLFLVLIHSPDDGRVSVCLCQDAVCPGRRRTVGWQG